MPKFLPPRVLRKDRFYELEGQQPQSASPGLAKYWRFSTACSGAQASSSSANRAAAIINLRSSCGVRSHDEDEEVEDEAATEVAALSEAPDGL